MSPGRFQFDLPSLPVDGLLPDTVSLCAAYHDVRRTAGTLTCPLVLCLTQVALK